MRGNTLVLVLASDARSPAKPVTPADGRPLPNYVFGLQTVKAPFGNGHNVAAQSAEFLICPEDSVKYPGPVMLRAELSVQHAEQHFGKKYDHVLVVQADTPVMPPVLLNDCLSKLVTKNADLVMTVLPVPAPYHPFLMYRMASTGVIHSVAHPADLDEHVDNYPPVYSIMGGCFAIRRTILPLTIDMGNNHPSFRRLAVVGDPREVLQVSTPADMEQFAQQILQNIQ